MTPRTTPKGRAKEIADRYMPRTEPDGKKSKRTKKAIDRAIVPGPADAPAADKTAPAEPASRRPATRKLTPREFRFAQEYIIDLNATQAAIRAGYSARTAGQIGYELLRKPEIQAVIADLSKARSLRTQWDADKVLQRLAMMLEADIADIHDEHGGLKPIQDWPLVFRQGLVAGIEVEEMFEGRGEDREHVGRVRKIKISDRSKLIEMIGKHVGVQAFKDKVEHDVADPVKALYAQLVGTGLRPDTEAEAPDLPNTSTPRQPNAIRPAAPAPSRED